MGGLGDLGAGIGQAGGAIAVMAGAAGQGGEKFLKQALEAARKLEAANYDMTALSPPELRLVREYFPEQYDAAVPPELRQAQDSLQGRQAQLGSLGYFEGVRDNGLPVETRVALDESQRAIGREAQGAQQAILDNLQARGRLGGGSELRARLLGNQQAMDLAGGLGQQVALEQLRRRFDAADRAAGLGSQLRGQDIALSQGNANIANNFNLAVAQMGNQAAQYNAGARERAQFQNVGESQRVGDTNELNRYGTMLENLNRQNSLRGATFDNNLARTQLEMGALGNLANARYAEQAARAANIQSLGQGSGRAVGGAVELGLGGGLGEVGDLGGGGGGYGGSRRRGYGGY